MRIRAGRNLPALPKRPQRRAFAIVRWHIHCLKHIHQGKKLAMTDQTKLLYRVLIVTDHSAVGALLTEMLAGPQRSIEVRDTGRSALEFLEHNPIDVAFVGATGTGTTGGKLAEKILERNPHAQVMVCDGLVAHDLTETARSHRSDRTSHKPACFGEMLQVADSSPAK